MIMQNMDYIERSLQAVLEQASAKRATVLFGARQVGKTTLFENLLPKGARVRWMSGDNPRQVSELTSLDDIEILLDVDYLVIDEAQRIPGIGLILKRLVDRKSSCKILVTGSSALELAGGIQESAVGRLDEYHLWPISLEELAQKSGWGNVLDNLNTRIVYGCYPEIITDPSQAKNILKTYLEGVLYKDLFALDGEIRKPQKLVHLLKCLAARTGAEVSLDALGNEISANRGTVAKYIDLLEKCYIIKSLPSYSRNVANEIKKGRKVYFCDTGIRNAMIDDFSPLSGRQDAGALWENFFIIERMKRHSLQRNWTQFYFWRTSQQQEVDFIEINDGKMRAFECKMSANAKVRIPETFKRAYPECEISVVNMQNFYKFLMNP